MSRHARPRRVLPGLRRVRGSLQPPVRKTPLLLTAAVAGALFAGLPLGLGSAAEDPGPASSVAAAATAQSWGIGGDVGMPMDPETETTARKELTAAEAEARLEVLRADRENRTAQAAERASRAAAERAAAARPDFVLPVNGRLTSCFCTRWGTMHWGIDLAAPMYTPIYAAGAGVVTEAGAASGFGNAIYIQHDNGDVTMYGHMEVVEVQAGDIVNVGDEIAKVGSRGYSTGPHLHFEVYEGGLEGQRVDPIGWLAARGVKV